MHQNCLKYVLECGALGLIPENYVRFSEDSARIWHFVKFFFEFWQALMSDMHWLSAGTSALALWRSGLSPRCHFKGMSMASVKTFISRNGSDANSSSIKEVWEFSNCSVYPLVSRGVQPVLMRWDGQGTWRPCGALALPWNLPEQEILDKFVCLFGVHMWYLQTYKCAFPGPVAVEARGGHWVPCCITLSYSFETGFFFSWQILLQFFN